MFDNVLGQESLVSTIRTDIINDTLPRALLLHGPRYSGKLTISLELARILNCQQRDAPWGCTCGSCNQHRLLMSPYTLMLGPRYFLDEITLSGKALAGDDKEALRYLFIRSVRKLTNRFEPILWEGEDQKLSKAISVMEGIEEVLQPLLPGVGCTAKKRETSIVKVRELAEKLVAVLPADGFSVNSIRRVSYWAHMTSSSAKKVIILEDADRLNDASRNSLLKILEEPPRGTHFILTTNRLTGIIPTLRSRLRVYHCPGRSDALEKQVLGRIFRLNDEFPGNHGSSLLQRAFESGRIGGSGELSARVESFFSALQRPSGSFGQVLKTGQWFEGLSPGIRRDMIRQFFQELMHRLEDSFVHPLVGSEEVEVMQKTLNILRKIDEQYQRYEHYNIPLSSVLEQVFFSATEV